MSEEKVRLISSRTIKIPKQINTEPELSTVVKKVESQLSPADAERLKHWGIHLGVPLDPDHRDRILRQYPTEPHVFFCKKVTLYAGLQQAGEISNVMIIHGHAINSGGGLKDWIFLGTRKSVYDTIKVYEEIAKKLNWPHLDMISGCRPKSAQNRADSIRVLASHPVDTPYIFPDSHIGKFPYIAWESPEQNKINPREGIQSLTFQADEWIGLDEWRKLREKAQVNRVIPTWAKMPAK